jgi:hypothetical protein
MYSIAKDWEFGSTNLGLWDFPWEGARFGSVSVRTQAHTPK